MTSLRPVTPNPPWEVLLALRSAAGEGPLVLAPAFERVLVVAPHPDDETIGCGATVAGLAARGAQVNVLVLSSGEASVITPGTTAAQTSVQREAEARAACRELGVAAPSFAALPDGGVGGDLPALADVLGRAIARRQPEAVFVPWMLEGHPDHAAVCAALALVPEVDGREVWCYEVWAALPANRVVDVTSTWPRKLAALACHRGRDAFDLDAHLALSRWRSIHGLDGHGYAEAFLVLTAEQLRAFAVAVLS